MEAQSQTNNVPFEPLLAKPAQAEVQLNSQGERIEAPTQSASSSKAPQQEPPHLAECSYEDVSLGDTPLAGPFDTLYPPTDDSDVIHAIISCGHVLKSTHDLARWSEKTGARRVNGPESLDAVSDLIVSLEAPKAQQQQQQQQQQEQGGEANLSFLFGDKKTGGSKSRSFNSSWRQKEQSKVISCGPVLKSTHDAATWSEKSGAHAVNSAASAGLLDEVASNQGNQKKKGNSGGKRLSKSPSQVINIWPVLKSTHDSATVSERENVNSSESADSLDDVACTQNQGGKQAGGSLQSGLDTQAGSHIQLEGSKAKETPEKAMEALHLHV